MDDTEIHEAERRPRWGGWGVRATLGWFRRGWWWKVPLTGLATVMVAVPLSMAVFHAWLDYRLSSELQSIRARGYPTHWSEIEAWLGPAPAAEANAAPLYEAAFAAIVKGDDPSLEGVPALEYEMWSLWDQATQPEMLDAARRHLEANREAMRLARGANALDRTRFHRTWSDGLNIMLPELGPLRYLMKLFWAQADLAAAEGDAAGAANAVVQMLELPDALEDDPFIISQLVRISINAAAFQTFERINTHADLTPEQLMTIGEHFRSNIDPTASQRAMAGERVLTGLWSFEGLSGGDLTLGEVLEMDNRRSMGWVRHPWNASGLLKLDRLMYLRVMGDLLDEMERGTAGDVDADALMDEVSRVYLVTYVLIPALNAYDRTKWRERSLILVAVTAAAAQRYRLDHGRYPATLEALVPRYLDRVETDSLDGQPIKYRVTDDGQAAVVYSVGSDGVDDGGRERPEGVPGGRRFTDGTDVTFSLGEAQERFHPTPEAE